MDRRSFLGTVIGTLAASSIPFTARALAIREDTITDEQRARIFGSLFDSSDAELSRYRLFAVAAGDQRFFAPGCKRIDRKKLDREMSVAWVSESINLSIPMDILGFGVMLPTRSIVLASGRFSGVVNMDVGDTLNCTYTLSLPILRPVDFS